MEHKTDNLRDLIYGNIDAIMANAQRLKKQETVDLAELLNDDFMQDNSNYQSVTDLFSVAGQNDVSQESIASIDDDLWEKIVASNTVFSSWDEMFNAASNQFIRQNLFKGIAGAFL
ncbi:hypothetical protein [Pseudovibrio sp. Tun.PSC04-5.I4]|uniref:hypothetical protein n=1 Tax=Pseudovibrio sp. Tun.PSC04-5.I4 TaxID=1798213 RepID=UPI000883EAC6|nr:hypothetical protein [Pseudovibrio sp. Tun.PSC04-5.I4]SDR48741.1 hypothetical protein SAMN04515695_6050 [Pseudovibrio sp. Tun.PSC04-5.I4]